MNNKSIADLRGIAASISLTGQVTYQFSNCWTEMRSYNETSINYRNVEYSIRPGVLVESARDSVVEHALKEGYDWILQIDADATFPRNTLHRLLEKAYTEVPEAGIVGAYATLKGPPHMPTIDTGTGRWEEHYPGEGMLPVIRTGCHCFLAKTWVFRKLGAPPWFRTRRAISPVQAFREVDGFVRQRLSGDNPLRQHPEWETLLEAAIAASGPNDSHVGEDSSLFDKCRAHDIPVYVDCDLITGHVANKILSWQDFRDTVRDNREMQKTALGVGL